MDFLRKLFSAAGEGTPSGKGSSRAQGVAKIVAAMQHMPPEQARFVASFAYILGRVARVEEGVSATEAAKMRQIVMRLGHLPEEQAALVVEVARHQSELFGHSEDFSVTQEFRENSSPAQREDLLDCLFAVSAADDSVSVVEEEQIRQIATELGFNHGEYVAARSAYSDKRDVLKDLPGS
jgi:uncharacterized tellurite resistance protein B-like protein